MYPVLRWRKLPARARRVLAGRLDGLYGAAGDAEAFDALAVDKQRALMIFARRLTALKLWRAVRRVGNVYGTGGVGLEFEASRSLARVLRRREDFTALLAAHRRAGFALGFRERRRARASLHFLCDESHADAPRWSVHFDLHNPLASPLGAWRHFYFESLRGATPDWRAIEAALKTTAKHPHEF